MKAIFLAFLLALSAEGQLANPDEEARAQDLMREIRCVACENEPISNSGSEIAADMRERVRTMVEAGASDGDVRDWFAERYGDFVLFRPPSRGFGGLLLWGTPFVLLLAGAVVAFAVRRRQARTPADIRPIEPEETS